MDIDDFTRNLCEKIYNIMANKYPNCRVRTLRIPTRQNRAGFVTSVVFCKDTQNSDPNAKCYGTLVDNLFIMAVEGFPIEEMVINMVFQFEDMVINEENYEDLDYQKVNN